MTYQHPLVSSTRQEPATPNTEGSRMPDVYTRAMSGTAILGGLVTTGYVVGTLASFADGIGTGLEIPHAINSMCIAVICCTTITSGCAWFARKAHRLSAECNIRPLIRQELDRAFAENMPLLVATIVNAADRRAAGVAEAVVGVVDSRIQDTAVAAARQTAARFREQQTADLTEICEGLHRKALIAGMELQANATGEQLGKSALRSVKTYVSTSSGD